MRSLPAVRVRLFCIPILLFVLILASPPQAGATHFIVYPDGSGEYPTIQVAYDAAADGDTILLADGFFTGPGNRDLDLRFTEVVIRSVAGDPMNSIVDLEGFPIGVVRGSTIERITFRDGGQLFCEYTELFVHDCIFDGMSEGIVAPDLSYVQVHDCLFTGGTGSQVTGDIDVHGCTFYRNHETVSQGWSQYFESCLFIENTADDYLIVGGTYLITEPLRIYNCQFLRNAVGDCVVWTFSPFDCRYSTFADNSGPCILFGAPDGEHGSGAFDIRGSTFVGNEGVEASDLLIDALDAWIDPVVDVSNSIFAFSQGGPPVVCMGDVDIVLECCDIFGNEGGDWNGCIGMQYGMNGNISEDPLFCFEAAESPHMLQDTSPCAPFTPPNAECDLIGAWPIGCITAGVEDDGLVSAVPRVLVVPNPVRTTTRILLPDGQDLASSAQLEIFDPSGRLLHAIPLNRQVYAADALVWDATDRYGRPLPSGTYYGRLSGVGRSRTEPIVVVR